MRLPTLALATWLVTGIGLSPSVYAHRAVSPRQNYGDNGVNALSQTISSLDTVRPSASASGNGDDATTSILLSITTSSKQARATSDLPRAPTQPPSSPPPNAPQPFDTSMSYALPTECLGFLLGMVSNPNFISCLPFSLLLTTSSGFNSRIQSAAQSHNYSYLNDLLAYTGSPQPSADACDGYMADFSKNLRRKENCGSDQSNTGVVMQARRGLGNYHVMRTAATLVHPESGVYCYIDALASARPDDLYLWKLPSGNILPPSSTPTCSPCSKLLMNHLTTLTDMSASLNTTTINNAASAINAKCGANFVSMAQRTGADDSSNISNTAWSSNIPSLHFMWLVISISFIWVFSF